jgi:hypothetical protein
MKKYERERERACGAVDQVFKVQHYISSQVMKMYEREMRRGKRGNRNRKRKEKGKREGEARRRKMN